MEVTPPAKVRQFLDIGAGGDSDSESELERWEGRVRTSQHFSARSSPPVGFIYVESESSISSVEEKKCACGCDRMRRGRTTVQNISIPIIPRSDPRFVFMRVPASSQCVPCLAGPDEDNLPI